LLLHHYIILFFIREISKSRRTYADVNIYLKYYTSNGSVTKKNVSNMA